MSRNVATTSGAVEGRRLGDASLFFVFFPKTGVIGHALFRMPWAAGMRKIAPATFGVSCYSFFLFFVSRPWSRKIPQLTHLRHYRGRVFFCSKNASIFGAVRANGKVSIIKGLRHVVGATNAVNSLYPIFPFVRGGGLKFFAFVLGLGIF